MALKIDYGTVKLQKVTNAIKITPPKIHHQNDVTKFFHFQTPLLAKSWLCSWLE